MAWLVTGKPLTAFDKTFLTIGANATGEKSVPYPRWLLLQRIFYTSALLAAAGLTFKRAALKTRYKLPPLILRKFYSSRRFTCRGTRNSCEKKRYACQKTQLGSFSFFVGMTHILHMYRVSQFVSTHLCAINISSQLLFIVRHKKQKMFETTTTIEFF